ASAISPTASRRSASTSRSTAVSSCASARSSRRCEDATPLDTLDRRSPTCAIAVLDLAQLRKDPDAVAVRLRERGVAFDLDGFRTLEANRKELQTRTEALQAQRNALSKAIGRGKAAGEDVSAALAESTQV